MQRPVIIDTDPGYDDALAILLAAKRLNLVGLTTVFGNETVDNTTINCLKLLEYAGLTHIPVAKGASAPLVHKIQIGGFTSIHGRNGLECPLLEDCREAPLHELDAVDFIIDTALRNPGLVLMPVGPLTNIALALHKAPQIKKNISEIYLMGGSITLGNVTPVAEVNIWCDPEAAAMVFGSGVPIKMVGLNVTYTAMATPERRERFHALTNKVGQLAADIIHRYSANYTRSYGYAGAALHDPCATAWMIDPGLFVTQQAHMDVELNGRLTRGMTVCDLRPPSNIKRGKDDEDNPRIRKPANGEVALKMDVDGFFDMLYQAVASY